VSGRGHSSMEVPGYSEVAMVDGIIDGVVSGFWKVIFVLNFWVFPLVLEFKFPIRTVPRDP